MPYALPSIKADLNASFISSIVLQWTGILKTRSHVDAVGLHLHFGSQLCTNLIHIGEEKPKTGKRLVPVMNFRRLPRLNWSKP